MRFLRTFLALAALVVLAGACGAFERCGDTPEDPESTPAYGSCEDPTISTNATISFRPMTTSGGH